MSKNNFNLCFVVPYTFIPAMNGGQKAAYGLANYLNNKVTLTCLTTKNNSASTSGININRLLPNSFLKYINVFLWPTIYKTLKENNASFCLTHQHFIFFLVWPICKILRIKTGIYIQNIEHLRFKSIQKPYWRIIYISEWIAYKLADFLFFISPDELPKAVLTFNLDIEKCSEIPYGVTIEKFTKPQKLEIRNQLNLNPEQLLILFFGPLSYSPNLEALDLMLIHIEPTLKVHYPHLNYKFIICGGGLPDEYNNLSEYPTFDYLGFVKDIELYIQASDVMLNPIISGGGVKTKLLESIAIGTTVVSSKTGALGA